MGWREDLAAAEAAQRNDPKAAQQQAQTKNTQATTAHTNINIKEDTAKLPYTAPQAGATLVKTQQDIDRDAFDLAQKKLGTPLGEKQEADLEALVSAYQGFKRLIPKFKPDYAGTILDAPTELESKAQDVYAGIGTPGQSDWWKDMNTLEIAARNAVFGASLQPNEERAWAATTISPGMDPKILIQNLQRRSDIIQEKLARTVAGLRAGNYRPAQIDAKLGRYVKDFTPEAINGFYEKLDKGQARTVPKPGEKHPAGEVTVGGTDASAPPPVAEATGPHVGGENLKAPRLSPESEQVAGDIIRKGGSAATYANVLADRAIQDGVLAPENREAFVKVNTASAEAYIAKFKGDKDALSAIPGGLNYEQADKDKQANATVGERLGQMARNAPETVAQTVEELGAPVVDTMATLATLAPGGAPPERIGVVKGLSDLAVEAAGAPLGYDAPTWKASADYLGNKYGTKQGFMDALTTHPLGIASDLAAVVGAGGGLISKVGRLTALPGAAGNFGSALERLGGGLTNATRYIDPVTGFVEVPKALVEKTGETVKRGLSAAIGHPSGLGGPALREGTAAGFGRNREGSPTPASEAFTENMRRPEANADDAVTAAQEAVANLQRQASGDYTREMAKLGKNPTPLDIDAVRAEMQRIKPKSYDAWVGAPNRPSDHLAWEKMNDNVEHYAAQAQTDPTLLHPLQMDQFKQDLYDIGSKTGGAFDRDAARIARTAYNGVKKLIVGHDRTYAKTMENYENAAKERFQIEETLGLATARGKPVNIDKAGRRLQSIMRNNAYTNYGQRAALGERLRELDPTGRLMPTLAGQTASSWTPRGISIGSGVMGANALADVAAAGGPGAMASSVLGSLVTGAKLAPLFSPRILGEIAYGTGRAAGTVARGVDAVAGLPGVGKVRGLVEGAYDTYRGHQVPALASSRLSSDIEGVQQQMDEQRAREDQLRISDLDAAYNGPEEFAYGGAVRRLSRKYACGGPVRYRS